jgi:tetratricopeptide (TPR) repeat protein
MKFWVCLVRSLPLMAAGLLLYGCLPSAERLDEEKEPHYLTGKSCVKAMDYAGAIEAFEKAIEVNPQSGSAHLELGVLLEQKESDPAAAIYHYERYLKLQPGAGNTDIVKQRILSCKQELARTVSLGPVSEKQQKDLEKLAEENKRLTEDNKRLTDDLNKWRTYYAQQRAQAEAVAPVQGTTRSVPTPSPAATNLAVRPEVLRAAPTNSSLAPTVVTARRTHTVKSGETLKWIAGYHGIRVDALMAANPRLDPRRIRPGQVINLP